MIRSPVFITIKIRSLLQATTKKKKRLQVEGDFSLKEKNQEKIQESDQEFVKGSFMWLHTDYRRLHFYYSFTPIIEVLSFITNEKDGLS